MRVFSNYWHWPNLCRRTVVLLTSLTQITRDIAVINERSKENIRAFVSEKLPSEFERIYIGRERGTN